MEGQESNAMLLSKIAASLFGWFFFIYPVLNKTTIYMRAFTFPYKTDWINLTGRFICLLWGLMFYSNAIFLIVYPEKVDPIVKIYKHITEVGLDWL